MPHFSRSQARPFCKGKSGVTAVLALSLAVPACIAGPLASLSGGEVGRIEFDSITPPDRWQFVRKNMDNTKSVTVHGDLLMPRTWGDPRVPAVIISHDRYFINKLATRVLELTPNGVQSYTGNYDDYMAHRAVTQQRTAAVKEKPKTNSYKEQKERASRLRKLRTAVTRLEAEIEETEAEIEELQAQLSAGADYQALMDLTAKLDAATARRDDLYARWENASEELAAGEEEV